VPKPSSISREWYFREGDMLSSAALVAPARGMLSLPFRFPFRWSLALRRPARGEERRFELLVATHLDAIYRTARRLGVRQDDVEDLVQEVLVVLARRLADIEVDKERAFALGITARLAANFRRKARRRPELLMAEMDGEADGASSLSPRSGLSGERCVEQAEALAVLRAGLEAMTEAQRVTFVLFELEELHASEIAAELGVAEAAVVSRLHRARRVMRRAREHQGLAATARRTELGAERQS
jgi:RNA polymerase sigma-70 factor (ECF subfamily)